MGLGIPQQVGDEEDYSLYSLKNISFEDNLREMMFGFGDSIEPYPETIKLMDELVKDFMVNLTLRGMDIAKRTNQPFNVDCIKYAVVSNRNYLDRLNDLLDAFSEISKQTRYHVSDASDSLTSRKHASHMGRENRKRQQIDDMEDD